MLTSRCRQQSLQRAAIAGLATALLLATTGPAHAAQTQPSQPPQLRFDEPYEIRDLGLRVFLPEDSLADLSQIRAGRTRLKVVPQGADQTWVIQIWNSISSNSTLSADQAIENIIEQRQAARPGPAHSRKPKSLVRVFDRSDDLLIGTHPARRAYFDVPTDPNSIVTGYTLFRTAPGQFIIIELDCASSAFTSIRQMYELMVASIEFRDPAELSSQRATSLLAGKALLDRFNNNDYTSALGDQPRFFRIYQPAPSAAPSDDREIAYQRLKTRRGFAGEVGGKKRSQWRPADRAPGFIVSIDARTVAAGTVADSVATFFLSDDRETELWSNRMTVRRGDKSEDWTETGFRFGKRLVVKTVQQGKQPTETRWDDLPDAYISRVQTYLLPRLAVRAEIEGDFGFYAYDSFLGKLAVRRDVIARKSPDTWTMTTTPSESSPSSVMLLDSKGLILQRTMPGGEIAQPIDPARLRQMWKQKGLPLN